jgi:hypothetical protein
VPGRVSWISRSLTLQCRDTLDTRAGNWCFGVQRPLSFDARQGLVGCSPDSCGVVVGQVDGQCRLGNVDGDGVVHELTAECDLLPVTMITPVFDARRCTGYRFGRRPQHRTARPAAFP